MIKFKQFILERKVDPEKLAVRAAKIYGKKTNYGFWEKPEKQENIPLSNFNSARAQKVTDKIWSYQRDLGVGASAKLGASDEEKMAAKTRELEGITTYKSKFSEKTMKISDLHATQPFIRIEDKEQLKNKINNTSPDNIKIVKYKNIHYIMDGHHAVMAAKFRGEKEIKVSHFDLDNELTKKKDVNEEIYNHFINENKINHSNIIDNVKGLGLVPNNSDIDYLGKRVHMTPSKFLSLAANLPKEHAKTHEHISNHIKSGGKIASPFLNISVHDDWRNGDLSKPPRVIGHDGRNRMYAVRDTLGDEPTEVHLFFRGHRARHITPEWIDKVHSSLIPEKD